jgi:hypothetical protein
MNQGDEFIYCYFTIYLLFFIKYINQTVTKLGNLYNNRRRIFLVDNRNQGEGGRLDGNAARKRSSCYPKCHNVGT